MIECRCLRKVYRGRVAVDGVDLVVAGGICGLLGANGAGKSTLLKLMTGLVKPDAGMVELAGLGAPEQAAVKQVIGVVPEELGLFETLSIEENLRLVGPVYGLPEDVIRERTAELLELLGLGGNARKPVSECSYGMRKKTALALALLHGPRVLFLDEPFEGIDPSSSRAIARMLRRQAASGVTVLMTSHNLPLVERLASRVVMMKRGRLVWDSGSDRQNGSLEETYFGLVDEADPKELSWVG